MSEFEERKVWWHSRRGMLELDLLLLPFVEARFTGLDSEAKNAYLGLLEQEDQDLYRWLIGSQQPEDERLQSIVLMIREFSSSRNQPNINI